MTSTTRLATVLGVSLVMLLAGCGGDDDGGGASTGGGGGGGSGGDKAALDGASFTVGSKEFTESNILSQMTVAVLEDAGAEVKDASLSGSATVREALEKSELDMYWEYTGTGWVNILGNTTEDVPEDLYEAVSTADKEENQIAWLEPAPMNDTYSIAVGKDFSEENSMTTMSDAATFINDNPDEGVLCAASEFLNRDDGLPGLEKAYAFEFSEVVELDLGLIYTQVGGKCNFGEVFSTDGRIVANDLVNLEDDKGFFVEYNAALTMRQETLDKYPAIADLIAPVSEALTNEEITALNAKVDVDGEVEEDVAREWLEEKGLLGG